ncbi:MAG: hypothetical protein JST55_09950 [Bacteroidetes bacterium]|nr:hypothetical protein [Bacteroidota bacterium]
MRVITPDFHAIMDYIMAILLVTSPFTLDYYNAGPETMLPVCLGLLALFITPMTEFRFAVIRVIPLRWHMIYDFIAGLFLMLSPWIFDFYRHVYMPHVIFGLLQIIASLVTSISKEDEYEAMKKIV